MTTVAVALLERAGELLICRRRDDQVHAGKWEFPGGKVEAGEEPAEALRRELREELGIETDGERQVASYAYAYPDKSPIRLVFFRVETFRGRIDVAQFAEARWASRAALPRYDFLDGDERIVRDLVAGRC